MIIVIHDKGSECSFFDTIRQMDPNAQQFEYQEKSDLELMEMGPEIILLAHRLAIPHCRALRLVDPSAFTRLIVVLQAQSSSQSINSRIAGADTCLVDPFTPEYLSEIICRYHQVACQYYEVQSIVRLGTVINDRYRPINLVGAGPHGVMLLVHDEFSGHDVMMKLIHKDVLSTPEEEALYLDTARKNALVQDPYRITPGETSRWNSMYYTVYGIELTKNLYEVMEEKHFEESEIVEFALSMIRMLVPLHSGGIYHLDIKPENLLFTGRYYSITEFGLPMPALSSPEGTNPPRWGGPAFMSPETPAADDPQAAESDVYSLGLLLYTLAARKNPLMGYSFEDTIPIRRAGIHFDDPALTLTPAFKRSVENMLQFEPSKRPRLQSLEIVFQQLHEFHMQAPSTKISSHIPTGTGIPRRSTVFSDASATASRNAEEASSIRERAAKRAKLFAQQRESMMSFTEYCAAHYVAILIVIFFSVSFFCGGYFFGRGGQKKTYFSQGPKVAFCCYSDHMQVTRTLDYRTVYCNTCGELTSPAYRCFDCKKRFGIALWPLRDMTEEEAEAFETKLKACPYCKSLRIRPIPPSQVKDEAESE